MKKIILLTLIFLNLCVILYADKMGIASFYTIKSSSNITANGERYDEDDLTCASNDYPFNTLLIVTNIENNKSVICRVNDRGNFKKYGRIIDLSKGTYNKIGELKDGLIKVKIEVSNKGENNEN